MDLANIYPYLVPAGYMDLGDANPPGITRPLGHGVHSVLVKDLGAVAGNLTLADVEASGLTADALRARAIQNLELLLSQRQMQIAGAETEWGLPFMIWGGHWLVASCIQLPRLYAFASGALKSADLRITIPHREAMIIFARGTRAQESELLEVVRQNESDGPKRLTWELFALTETGIAPV